jgi:probable metal-binding protein
MSESIHGHEVMEMILTAEPPYSRADLEEAVRRRFGDSARFHTCSAQDMTLDELLRFLDSRGKLFEVAGEVRTSRGHFCNHDTPSAGGK